MLQMFEQYLSLITHRQLTVRNCQGELPVSFNDTNLFIYQNMNI